MLLHRHYPAVDDGKSEARFPPPWTVEETDACLIVRDHRGTPSAYVHFRP